MKFIIRRFIVGLIATPVVALVYGLGYYALALVGATPTMPVTEVVVYGFVAGLLFAIMFAFWSQISRLAGRI